MKSIKPSLKRRYKMDYKNGKVLVSKKDCKALRLVIGCNDDLRIKLGSRYLNQQYYQAQSVTKLMIGNHLWLSCNADELSSLLSDSLLQYNLTIKMLKGDYDYEKD